MYSPLAISITHKLYILISDSWFFVNVTLNYSHFSIQYSCTLYTMFGILRYKISSLPLIQSNCSIYSNANAFTLH